MRCAQQCGTRRFQSTTPLGRRHFFGNIVVFDIPISIHDSARKATTDLRASCNDIRISIHASAREATIFRCPTPGHNHFNPRLREGGDLSFRRSVQNVGYFNPRLREGGDNSAIRSL